MISPSSFPSVIVCPDWLIIIGLVVRCYTNISLNNWGANIIMNIFDTGICV